MPYKKFVDYTRLDQKLFEIAGAMESNLLKYINPINMVEQKKIFFEALEKNEKYNPIFSYIPKNLPSTYFSKNSKLEVFTSELRAMIGEIGREDLGIIFESEIIDLLEKIEMLKSIGTENFAGNTESYYGNIPSATIRIAKQTIKENPNENCQTIPFETAIKTINAFLKKNKLNYKITLREPTGARFAVINSRKEILISKDTIFTKEMVDRLIAHEIETHIYRYENGMRQPYKILAHGFSRETTETEEGLATCVEKIQGVSSQTQIKEYAGRLIAINEAVRKNFYDTFTEMNKYFDKETAFRLTLRAKRGIKNQENPGAFFKDALYFKGMLKVEEFLKKHAIKELYYAKYAVEDIHLIKNLPGLKEPKYFPNALTLKISETISLAP